MGRIATRFVVLVAFVITASMMGAPVEAASKPQPAISSATVSADQTTLFVDGEELGPQSRCHGRRSEIERRRGRRGGPAFVCAIAVAGTGNISVAGHRRQIHGAVRGGSRDQRTGGRCGTRGQRMVRQASQVSRGLKELPARRDLLETPERQARRDQRALQDQRERRDRQARAGPMAQWDQPAKWDRRAQREPRVRRARLARPDRRARWDQQAQWDRQAQRAPRVRQARLARRVRLDPREQKARRDRQGLRERSDPRDPLGPRARLPARQERCRATTPDG